MKKTLFACVALSVFYTTAVCAQTEQQPTQTQPAPTISENQNIMVASAPSAQKIAEAFEIGLLYYGFDSDVEPKVEQKGNDFLISIGQTHMTDATGKVHDFPAAQVQLTRVDDFGRYAQYKMENTTLPYLKSVFSTLYPAGKITDTTSNEIIFWVPDLALRTKQSFKTGQLNIIDGNGTQIEIAAIHADGLTQAKENNKMDSASTLDVDGLVFKNALTAIVIPHLSASSQVLNAEQTADALQQALSATFSKGEMSIPQITLTSTTPMFAPVNMKTTGKIETVRDEQSNALQAHLTLNIDQLNLQAGAFENGTLPAAFPANIRVDTILTDLNAEQLKNILKMQEKLDTELDEQTPENIALQAEIQKQYADILDKVRLNINEIALENPVAAMRFTGTGRFVDQMPSLTGQLAVTNFDLISPDYRAQCAAEKTKQPQTEKQPAAATEPTVCHQMGVLDNLRPYLDTAEKTTQDNKPVVIFNITYREGQTFINNKPFVSLNTPKEADKTTAQ